MEQPPKRLLLACNLADKASYSEILFNQCADDWFPRGMTVARVCAWVGGRARKYAALVPFRSEMGDRLSKELVRPMLKSAVIRALAENPNIIGPVNRLPK